MKNSVYAKMVWRTAEQDLLTQTKKGKRRPFRVTLVLHPNKLLAQHLKNIKFPIEIGDIGIADCW